jgi:hypothetical protein
LRLLLSFKHLLLDSRISSFHWSVIKSIIYEKSISLLLLITSFKIFIWS